MIYLTNGNMPLNAAYADEIVQEDNSTYQLTFRFPTSDSLWEKLKEETFLTADDLHGEQDFVIFEVEKKHGYIQVYANQVFTLLNNYVVSSLALDRATGSTALSRFAGAITRDNPFSFFSDIEDRHTFNVGSKNAMEAFAKDKHSILGQWGGDLVRHGYQVRLLKNGGSENESLFMYKKNLSSYQHKTSTKSLKTRITFKTTVKGEGEKAPDRKFSVVVDSPLINKYSQIYEDVIEVNDEDVKDEASLRKYGEQYFKTSLCDMMEDSLELEVVGQSDVPVQMYDIVSLFHEVYNLDVRKKITKYTYSPMAKKLISIGFGQFKSGLANAIGNAVSDAVKGEAQQLQNDFERQLARELKNADLAFDRQKKELVNQFTDGLNAAKARAEEVKRELSDTIDQRFSSFNSGPLQEVKRRAEEALRNAGASSLLAQEAKRIGLDSIAKLEEFKSQATSAQTALSGDLDALKRTVTSEVNQASEHRRTTTEALSRMTGQMNGFATKSEVRQDVVGLTETFAKLKTDTNNLISGAKSEITLAKTEFQKTADGLSAKMSAVESYVGQDSQRQEALRRYTREESARQATAVRELVTRDYVGKTTYQEDVRGLERRFSTITTQTNNDIATKIAQYKQTVDGQFANITSQIAGKANLLDFQRVQETSKLYERIIGRSESDIADKVARMALTNQLFQVEIAKNASDGQNLLKGSKNFSGDWKNMAAGWKKHSDKYQGCDVLFKNNSWNGVGQEIDAKIGGIYTFSLWMKSDWKNDTVNFYVNKNGSVDKGWGVPSETSVAITSEWKRYSFTFKITANGFIFPRVERLNQNTNLYVAGLKLEKGSYATPYTEAPEDTDEAIRTVQSQLAGSWAVQNINSAGSIVSQINATNNQILIEAEKIRLKGKTLLDELTAIDGYFKRLFVGEGEFAKLNAEIIASKTITADKLVMDQAMARMFVSSDIFTDTLAAKEAFINKLRSVVVSATLLEGYKGKIGGFQIGTHDKDPHTYWLTGQNQFYVGMSSGAGSWGKTALWVNWGTTWESPGKYAWFVKESGAMYCYNTAHFWNTPVIHGDLRVTGYIYYNNENSGKSGYWIHSSKYLNFEPSNDYLYLYYAGSKYDWIPMNKEISDRRYKHNIEASTVSGLDVVKNLKTYRYRKEYDGRIEDISCGIMAQDVQKYAPEAFYENPDGAYSYRTFELVPYLIKAIQELNHKIEKLEKTA
ncbi:phage tail spike protein [Streptococcus sp. F0441]|uniref:phage tail spike protein n=1 Tax=Streptococcus sp. F0441 TaxID=999424 RepID=UPI0002992DC1|nr:phage tail spike protein [Streptococcus sp. F0441]EKS16967.1 phage minor structural protein [Streptococcus sp. F0441]